MEVSSVSVSMRKNQQPDILGSWIASRHLFFLGILLIPSFLFQSSLIIRTAQSCLFIGLAVLSGRRIRPWPILLTGGSVLLMNLLAPIGRILFRIGPLPITDGALHNGSLKAVTIIGLMYLSLFTIRPDVHLPGQFGGLVSRVFFYFERFLQAEKRLDRKNMIGSLDTLLDNIYRNDSGDEPGDRFDVQESRRTSPWGYWLLLLLLAVNWGVLLLTMDIHRISGILYSFV